MPDLVDMHWGVARNELLRRNLDLQIHLVEVAREEAQGIVVETMPPAGESLGRGYTVTLRYSGGQNINMVTVPALNLPTTRAALKSAFSELDLELEFDAFYDVVLEECTVTHIRNAGESVPTGSVIVISISVRPEPPPSLQTPPPPVVTSITILYGSRRIHDNDLTLFVGDESIVLTARVEPHSVEEEIVWHSSDRSVFEVVATNPEGAAARLTSISQGTATLTVSVGGLEVTYIVRVRQQ